MAKTFNEWVTDRVNAEELSSDDNLGMETEQDDALIESQLEQWVTRLAGLLQNIQTEKKQQLLGKVVSQIREMA